jgi:hypothetical protein
MELGDSLESVPVLVGLLLVLQNSVESVAKLSIPILLFLQLLMYGNLILFNVSQPETNITALYLLIMVP